MNPDVKTLLLIFFQIDNERGGAEPHERNEPQELEYRYPVHRVGGFGFDDSVEGRPRKARFGKSSWRCDITPSLLFQILVVGAKSNPSWNDPDTNKISQVL